jgi:hypothetical protein
MRLRTCIMLALLLSAAGALVPARAQDGRVEGVVFDSLRGHPLAGAEVQLVDSSRRHGYAARTDSLGRFHLDSVAAGGYVVGALDAVLDTLGVAAPLAALSVAPGAAARVALAIPPAVRLIRAICGPSPPHDTTGILVGHVIDEASRATVGGSTVALVWTVFVFDAHGARSESRQLHAKTNADGWFAMCGLQPGEYTARAELAARATGFVDVRIAAREIERTSFALGADSGSAHANEATLAGTVAAVGGLPVEGAQVVVEGSAAIATTDARGAFSLTALPDGTHMAEVRAIGYAPTRVAVDLSRDDPRSVAVVMSKRAHELAAVTVFGTPNGRRLRDVTGFLERQRKGFGHFLNAAQIDRENAPTLCDLLRRVNGVTVQPLGITECTATIRGAFTGSSGGRLQPCEPTLYLDDMPFSGGVEALSEMVRPSQIMGIEVYTAGTQPAQFGGGCGAIIVWTRR